ncbi:MAG: glycosyltransferase family 2 protein [Candidatus Scalinduaceae bacterium]
MKVSVVLIVFNEEKYIKKCVDALLRQTFLDFEIVVINNGSTDGTGEIINFYNDARIKYFVENAKCGLSRLRNIGIEKSKGEYVFFTDGDCIPNKYWLEEGLRTLQDRKYVGVEGKTYYESANTTISNVVMESYKGFYMTCNIGYRREVLDKINCFDPNFTYGHEDRDLAIRVLKHGKICFSEDMIVVHQLKKLSIKELFTLAKRAGNMVYLLKVNGKRSSGQLRKNILYPNNLLIILFPPILILGKTFRSGYDFILAFFQYFAYIYERIVIWKAAIKNRIFIL